jgi:hypothetical protein
MLLVNVDYFSSGKVTGWTNARLIGSSSIVIKTNTGLSQDISKKISAIRKDVNIAYNYNANDETGFNINLFDMFNDRVKSFDIYVDGFKAWSSKDQLDKLSRVEPIKDKMLYEVGSKRIFIIFEKNSWLDSLSGILQAWSKNQFIKNMCNGIAISFVRSDQLKELIGRTDLSKSNNIFIIERSTVRQVIIENQQTASCPIFIMEEKLDLSLDYSGVLSSIFFMNGWNDKCEVTAQILWQLIETLITYSDMFFVSDPNDSLLHIHGNISSSMMHTLRKFNSAPTVFKGCLIVSSKKIRRMSDFNKGKYTLFINSALLRNTFDIINSDPIEFLNICFKRGIKVKCIKEGDAL